MTETSNKNLISRTLASRMMSCIEEYEAIKERKKKQKFHFSYGVLQIS